MAHARRRVDEAILHGRDELVAIEPGEVLYEAILDVILAVHVVDRYRRVRSDLLRSMMIFGDNPPPAVAHRIRHTSPAVGKVR